MIILTLLKALAHEPSAFFMRQVFSPQAYKQIKKATNRSKHKSLKKEFGMFAPTIPQCKIHKRMMIKKPPGVSKYTHKPYKAFWACPIRDSLGYCSQTYSSSNDTQQVNKLTHWK